MKKEPESEMNWFGLFISLLLIIFIVLMAMNVIKSNVTPEECAKKFTNNTFYKGYPYCSNMGNGIWMCNERSENEKGR